MSDIAIQPKMERKNPNGLPWGTVVNRNDK